MTSFLLLLNRWKISNTPEVVADRRLRLTSGLQSRTGVWGNHHSIPSFTTSEHVKAAPALVPVPRRGLAPSTSPSRNAR